MSKSQFLTAFTAIGASVGTILFTGEITSAITLTNTSVTPSNGANEFVYSLTLEADETIFNATDNPFGFADTLDFENLVGVTDVTTPIGSPYQVVGFDDTNINLEVATTINGPTTISNALIITANAFPGDVDATITFSDANGPNFGENLVVTGPGTPVPFEAETTTGVAVLGLFMAGRTYWKRRQKNA